jgi:hypothetical protein
MRDRVTTKDLERQLEQYVGALKDLGMLRDGYRIVLSHGSKSNGIAFRINRTGECVMVDGRYTWPNGSGHNNPPTGDDFLGFTKADAYHTLNKITRTLWRVKQHQARVPQLP